MNPEELPAAPSADDKMVIALDENIFGNLLDAAGGMPKKQHDTIVSAVSSSARSVFGFVGRVLGDMLGEPRREDEEESDSNHNSPGGSPHNLGNALSPAIVVAGIVGRVNFPYKKLVHPCVNGERDYDKLTTDEERAEWRLQDKRFERDRAEKVRALKNISMKYAMRAVRAYEEALRTGGDANEALRRTGVPDGAIDAFMNEVAGRAGRIRAETPEALDAAFRDLDK